MIGPELKGAEFRHWLRAPRLMTQHWAAQVKSSKSNLYQSGDVCGSFCCNLQLDHQNHPRTDTDLNSMI